MGETRSGFSRERLAEILRRVREIGQLDDSAALEALDEVLSALRLEPEEDELDSDIDWQLKSLVESMERIRSTIVRVRAAADAPGHQVLWDAQRLLEDADQLDHYIDSSLKTKYKDEFAQLRAEAKQAAREAERAAHTKMIQEHTTQVIHNASSVKSVIAGIDRAIDALRKLGPVPDDLSQVARQGKERAARYRSQKKLDEADVAVAGGNARKAEKLRKEAAALLTQDWAQTFPGEQAPSAV